MGTAPAKHQRRLPPAAGEGEPEAKRSRLQGCPDSAGGHRRVVLNPADCDLDFDIDGNGLQGHALHEEEFAYCWSGARATVGITGGKFCFGCRIISEQKVQMEDTAPDQRHLCRLGISKGDDPAGNLGESDHSFGFGGTGKFSAAGKFSDYGAKFGVGDTIVCAVNLENMPLASIGYSLNGKWFGYAKQFDAGPKGLGVLNSALSKRSWGSALFPLVLLKNVVVQMQFSIEDGLNPEEGYKPWSSAFEGGHAVIGPSFPATKECEVMMMVGLPASGKTTWAEKWVKDHPEKKYVLLGTNLALEHMKVSGLLCKQNYGGSFDRLMDRATKIFHSLLSRACKTPHNYIIDQTNVYKSARKRMMQPFVHFRKIAVVVFPTPDVLKSRAERRFKEMGKEVPAEAVNEMLAHYVFPVSKDMPRADECFDEVTFPELDRSEAQKYLEEMKSVLRSASNLSGRTGFSSFNPLSYVTGKVESVRDRCLSSIRPIYSPHYSDPGGFRQRNSRGHLHSPELAVELSCAYNLTFGPQGGRAVGSTKSSAQQTQGGIMAQAKAAASASPPMFPAPSAAPPHSQRRKRRRRHRVRRKPFQSTSPFASQADEEDTWSTQASSPPEDEDVNSQESIEEAPPHMANPNVEETGPSPSRVEIAAPPNPSSGDKSLSPSASLEVQKSVLLTTEETVVEGHNKPVPSADFPEHGIEWPEGPQSVPLVGAEIVLDTLISSVRSLFRQQEEEEEAPIPTVEAVRSALQRGTRAYHILGLPKEPWITAVESTWGEFRRAHAASEWKSCRLEIQRLEDEISALSDEARGLHPKAEDARGRRSALEAKRAADKKVLSQYHQAIRYFMEEAKKLAAVVKTDAKAVELLQAEEATFTQKDSDLQREIATRRARVEELNKKKNPPVGSLTSASSVPP